MTSPQLNRKRGLLRQIARIQSRETSLNRLSNRYAWARLIEFAAGAILSFMLLYRFDLWPGLIGVIVWLVGFSVLARCHNRVKTSITRHSRWRAIKVEHVARLALDWPGLPPALFSAPHADRPLERDLDLVGPHSLHHLLDISVSYEGSSRLRDWLAAGEPAMQHIRTRQILVRQLMALPGFRDKLRLNAVLSAGPANRHWHGSRLVEWLTALPPTPLARPILLVLTALAALNIVLFMLDALAGFAAFWRVTFMIYLGLYLWRVHRLEDPFSLGLALRDPLEDLKSVFTFLETYRYSKNAALRDLCAPFLDAERRPSTHLAQVTRVLAAASVRRNPILWMLFSAVLPWDLYVVYALNRSRAKLSAQLPQWLDVWYELEALCSLATFAYLNPYQVFPELRSEGPLLDVRGLGHPLIPDGERVTNDFVLHHAGELALITGSNMSGKSTFLRTLGVNLCLAYAGGTVSARSFHAAPLRLVTCIRITDSLADGISYFYAEVKCLKGLLLALEQAHAYPVFYLIDEIFRGTNNRERLIGSRAYIRAVVGRNGAGVLSTHDLELVRLADEIPAITNFHFAETITDSHMTFDYKLRPGPCPTTNALKIMQLEGLPVDPDERPT